VRTFDSSNDVNTLSLFRLGMLNAFFHYSKFVLKFEIQFVCCTLVFHVGSITKH